MARNLARGSNPPGCECCRCSNNRARTVAGGQRHIAVDPGRRGRIHYRHRPRKRESKAKEQKACSATSSNSPCADRGRENRKTGIFISDAANKDLGTRVDGR